MIFGLAAGMMFFILIILAIAILFFIFWIFMLIDCAKRNFRNDSEKVIWIIVIALLGAIGAAVYYFAVKMNDKKIKKIKSKNR